jgi:dTDP-4-amino-4,6-dideoxygalactose transaminase
MSKEKVLLVDLAREYVFLKKQIDKAIAGCLKSQHWILGQAVADFEKEAAQYLGCNHTVGVASGTDALLLPLRALAIKHTGKEYFTGDAEIVTTAFTFAATAETIMRSGARPVFVDIDQDTFNIDPAQIKKAITKNTVGILPVHLFGQPADMGAIMSIAKENGLFVMEDTAQAMGSVWREKKSGTIGDCGAFSFFPTKTLGCYGDGGMISTDDDEIADLCKVLRNHGQTKTYDASYIGYNSRLDALQAAILSVKLKYLDKWNKTRAKTAESYKQELKGVGNISLPKVISQAVSAYNLFTIKAPGSRDKLLEYLNSQNIEARVYYPHSLAQMKAFKNCRILGALENTKNMAGQVLSLPNHPFLKQQDIKFICGRIKVFFRNA